MRTARNCLAITLLLLAAPAAIQAAALDQAFNRHPHPPDSGATSCLVFMSLAGLALGVRR